MSGCSNETGPVGAVITGTGAPVPTTGPWADAALAPANTMATEASNPLLIGLPFKLLISGPSDLKEALCRARAKRVGGSNRRSGPFASHAQDRGPMPSPDGRSQAIGFYRRAVARAVKAT